jgi:leucyl-tRNA synthetase
VLANEQVIDGACERCHNPVIQKEMAQWFFRITKFADALLAEIDRLNWPDHIKAMQRNWIGRSEGAEIEFHGFHSGAESDGQELPREFSIPVFTTRPDTLFGVSYVVLAPEHPLVDALTHAEYREAVVAYRDQARRKNEIERTSTEREKTGTPIGAVVRHPITNEEIPVWIADYVLMNYGTGAVMGVPSHDARDFAFAKRYGLSIQEVIAPMELAAGIHTTDEAYVGPGVLVNSGEFNGITSEDAKRKIVDALEGLGRGKRVVNFHLRDWLVSRQRYWGSPIPIIWCEGCGMQPVPVKDLPVRLPDDVDFRPTGESPLARSKSFHDVSCPSCGNPARRESDTMDTFVDSSWYFLRYCDPQNDAVFADAEKVAYWCPVDLYVGGAEHAVLHLLYARFFAHALHEHGYLAFREPFTKLRSLGLILGPDGQKMSKSRGNVINPDDVVREYGADTLRLYEMFMGPFEDAAPWKPESVVGVRRFLEKAVAIVEKRGETNDPDLIRSVQKCIKRVSEDIEAFKFNTAVAELMKLINAMQGSDVVAVDAIGSFVKLLAPFAPHLAEELWERLGNTTSVFEAGWPTYDPALAKDDLVEVAIQVNGKLRGTMTVAPDLPEAEAKDRALATENVQKHLAGKSIAKVIYVPGRLINIVVR